MARTDDSLNESVAKIVSALIESKKVVAVSPDTSQEEVTSCIERVKKALSKVI